MLPFLSRRVQIEEPASQPPRYDNAGNSSGTPHDSDEQDSIKLRPSDRNVTEDQVPFLGVKVRRTASRNSDYRGDYLDVPSRPYLIKIIKKHGDKTVMFADRVLKFTSSGKMKRRILLITDSAVYIIDPETDVLKRRIALAAVEKICLSELSDNFLAIVIPTEYDILMASTRKTEIVTALVQATKSASDYELDLFFSNRFEYNATADLVKKVEFEEIEGGVRTRIARK